MFSCRFHWISSKSCPKFFHHHATFRYEWNNINANCLKKNNIKYSIRGYSRMDFAKVIITHPNIAQNTQNFFFPDSLVVFVPYHKFLGSRNWIFKFLGSRNWIYVSKKKTTCCAFVHVPSKLCSKLILSLCNF